MKTTPRLLALAVIGLAIITPINSLFALDNPPDLTAQWWQWALSIPTSVNPMLDGNGDNCMVGQRDSVWFLAGAFFGGTAKRTCSVPEGVPLFFPVANAVNFNAPNICGQTGSLSTKDLRDATAAFVNGLSQLAAELDGRALSLQRIRSRVFELALPEDNVFDGPCASIGNVPAGIYSPAVDEGFYASVPPLRPGNHTIHFHAENSSQGFVVDVTYTLHVVAVSK